MYVVYGTNCMIHSPRIYVFSFIYTGLFAFSSLECVNIDGNCARTTTSGVFRDKVKLEIARRDTAKCRAN